MCNYITPAATTCSPHRNTTLTSADFSATAGSQILQSAKCRTFQQDLKHNAFNMECDECFHVALKINTKSLLGQFFASFV